MSEDKKYQLLNVAKELNIALNTAVDALAKSGYNVEGKPNTKIDSTMYNVLQKSFQKDKEIKEEAKHVTIKKSKKANETPVEDTTASLPQKQASVKKSVSEANIDAAPAKVEKAEKITDKPKVAEPKKVASTPENNEPVKAVKPVVEPVKDIKVSPKEEVGAVSEDVIRAKAQRLSGPNIIGKIELPSDRKPSSNYNDNNQKNKRKRNAGGAINTNNAQPRPNNNAGGNQAKGGENKGGGNNPNRQNNQNRPNNNAPRQGGNNGQQSNQQGSGQQGFTPRNNNNQRSNYSGNNPQNNQNRSANNTKGRNDKHTPKSSAEKEEIDEKKVQEQIKQTLAKLTGSNKNNNKFASGRKHRRNKRDDHAQSVEDALMQQELEAKLLKVTEFVTANELASMMDVPVTKIIATCMSLGLFVSINQRLDAETLTIVADEFGYKIEFVSADIQEELADEQDAPEDLEPRSPIITVMGHVDHGKTSLLDFIRKANVIAGEAGGITQHIGAYSVKLENGKQITFLDTPGHEAFTAMRARGAKLTDIAIIVIAADDAVMPQTIEAINHAQAAGVPIVFAFNKIDRPGANSEKIREQLAAMNILVEEWGGKYQTQEISAKKGLNIDLLLEKVLLEAEMLDLKANPNKRAVGTVVEATLDKGRGIVSTVLIQSGTLKVGDPILAGSYYGKVKALFNERGVKMQKAGPSTPALVLGLQGAPTAGDKFSATKTEHDAKEIANKRNQLLREQGLRTQKHITLDEIGRRLAIGNFKELNIIIKGDVDGSVEALSDSLLKLSTEEIQVKIIHKSVGQISDSDVLLASASDAIIIGFQVRPSASARKVAEQEQIDIRLYSIIYKAIEEIKAAMEGMLSPDIEEKIIANVQIRETFKISKVGTIAGCMVIEGKIHRNNKIRIIRDGVVVHNGTLDSLKRFKDDVKEVATGYECGLNIKGFNDIYIGDIVEAYEEVEIKRKL